MTHKILVQHFKDCSQVLVNDYGKYWDYGEKKGRRRDRAEAWADGYQAALHNAKRLNSEKIKAVREEEYNG